MKIRSIRIHNLNSLRGKSLIDFEAEPFSESGIFVITGSTGAGKSTILDALTLALYGKVARYGSRPNPEDVMHRGCGECAAEVEFQVKEGIYRARWELRRARGSASGKIQPAKRYLYDQAGQSITQKIEETNLAIEQLLGLNYDRFLRSVMLAQGQFAQFLESNDNDRAELLEKITGTDIYSRLGQLAYEEANAKGSNLEQQQHEIDRIEILEKEEREQIQQQITTDEKAREELKKTIEKNEKLWSEIETLRTARAEEQKLKTQQTEILDQENILAPKLEELAKHNDGTPYFESLLQLDNQTVELQKNRQDLAQLEEKIKKSQQQEQQLQAHYRFALEKKVQEIQRQKKENQKKKEEWNQVLSDDQKWIEQNQDKEKEFEAIPSLIRQLTEQQQLTQARETIEREIIEMAKELDLSSALSISEKLEINEIERLIQKVEERQTTIKNEGVDRAERLKTEKELLEAKQKIASLTEHRHDLKEGEECPLCGSKEHPYTKGLEPTGESELQKVQKQIKASEEIQDALREKFNQGKLHHKKLKSSLPEISDKIKKEQKISTEIQPTLHSLGMDPRTPMIGDQNSQSKNLIDQVQSLQQEYLKRKERWQKGELATSKLASVEERLIKEEQELQKKRTAIKQTQTEGLDSDLNFETGIGIEDLDELEENWNKQKDILQQSTGERKAHEKSKNESEAKVDEITGKLESEIKSSTVASIKSITSIDELRAIRLAPEKLQEIQKQKEELQNLTSANQALRNQVQTQILSLTKKKIIEGDAVQTFIETKTKSEREREEIIERLTTRKNAIELDDQNQKKKEQAEKEIKKELEKIRVWRQLKDLIGSADGKKFRRYAQTISLDLLTRHANRHLAELNSRYQLCRQEEGELHMEIVDFDQGNQHRSVTSLSGGEKFLVSLALALGLSELAGRKVQLQSLFIDEGFGSLDLDTLEVAISALEGLRQKNKRVGVISHVELLKERISTQIAVEKKAGGVSEILIAH